ncbi:MAG: LysR family transcriptional regulator [Anaerolineae bacterium]|nr:LysR family transcriptional regulator [Anaerolineae bacterium]
MLHLNELEIFVAAAEHGSFSEAARFLHLSQPAVSQSIQSLERRFRVQLFSRQGRTARLSDSGKALLPLARELIAAARRVEETMNTMSGTVAGHIHLGCSTSSGKYIMPSRIAQFRALYPAVRVDVHVCSRDVVVQQLLEEEVDFVISSRQLDHRDLEFVPFCTDEATLIVPANHRWTRNRHIYPDDLLDESIIMREEGSGTYVALYEALRAHDIAPEMLNVAMTLGNAEAVALAVEEGLGVGFVSKFVAARSIALGRAVEVTVEGFDLRHALYFVRNRRTPMTHSQRAFWDFMQVTQPEYSEASK